MAQHQLWSDGQDRGIEIAGWSIQAHKAPILNAAQTDKATAELDFPLPEICFGNNSLTLRHKASRSSYVFDTMSALHAVDPTGEHPTGGLLGVKVAHANEWQSTRDPVLSGWGTTQEAQTLKIAKKFDWSYTTAYPGHSPDDSLSWQVRKDHNGIPMERLASQTEPILFFEEVCLFEDELHDCGTSRLDVRIRVMPFGFFVLSRFFLRIDRVLFRIFDTRLFHDFATNEIIRETRGRQAAYDTVLAQAKAERKDDLSALNDPVWVAHTLGLLDRIPSSTSTSAVSSTASYLAQNTRQASTVVPGVCLPNRTPQIVAHRKNQPSESIKLPTWNGDVTQLEIAQMS
ncbi:uncharacterized protein L969DRAFT_49418 [Mixia osmundae IAM 14324]|uniref:TIP41-like protein n=1 Tax=Mixia osmundae (strain CBS 9802 / IAM 14324 / JCM 22182 / KY 12970) TaxID=764103 RepID=G7DVV5_MIXOS|nr:uncharacterized protein L969DRAFT_49418 [Mixia osmundae IAM 14324]KEI39606.1 hypothetical protein L969DRAFT_49418 [Mixia osmundae IAM 14324]GAA94715.1 hypothetical protein E5Q_01368 [Mixia osmundae IAM 14324]